MKELIKLPNLVTLLRLISAIPVALIVYKGENNLLNLVLIVLVGFTDILDGFLARHLNMVSKTGMLLDPLADKVLVVGILIALVAKGELPWLWLLILAVKELALLLGGVILLFIGRTVPAARAFGKLATLLILTGICASLIPLIMDIGLILIKWGIIVSLLAGLDYFFLIRSSNNEG